MNNWAHNSLFRRTSYALLMVNSVPALATSCNNQNLDAAQTQVGEGATFLSHWSSVVPV